MIVDRDDQGYRHARQVHESLVAVAASVTVVEPASGKDVSDHLDAGHSFTDLVLLDLDGGGHAPNLVDPETGPRVRLVRATDVPARRTLWLWENRIPLGDVAITVGQEGIGKSTFVIDLAARATRGQLPGDRYGTPVCVVYATAEDSPERTLKPRFAAAGADLGKVFFVTIDGLRGGLVVPTHLDPLAVEMEAVGAKLLVLDPLGAHMAEKIDTHRDSSVRQALAPLAALMDTLDSAAVGIMHWNKGMSNVALDRLNGSRGFSAAARTVIGFGIDPEDPAIRLVVPVKANLAPGDVAAVRYRIEGRPVEVDGLKLDMSGIVMLGEAPDVRPEDLFAHPDSDQRAERTGAEEFLMAYLGTGRVKGSEVKAAARGEGIAERTLQRAATSIGVRQQREGFGPGSVVWWSLPDPGSATQTPYAPTKEAGVYDTYEPAADRTGASGSDEATASNAVAERLLDAFPGAQEVDPEKS